MWYLHSHHCLYMKFKILGINSRAYSFIVGLLWFWLKLKAVCMLGFFQMWSLWYQISSVCFEVHSFLAKLQCRDSNKKRICCTLIFGRYPFDLANSDNWSFVCISFGWTLEFTVGQSEDCRLCPTITYTEMALRVLWSVSTGGTTKTSTHQHFKVHMGMWGLWICHSSMEFYIHKSMSVQWPNAGK